MTDILPETQKIYDEDACLTEFTARVLSCTEAGGYWQVVLDRTAFFPEAGGQTSDRGELILKTEDGSDGEVIRVTDVQIDEERGLVLHAAEKEIPAGSILTGRIDWKHRFDNMQQHSGEHIFSGLVCAAYGCDNVGFHLSDDTVTMDYNRVLTQEEIAGIERRANEVIWQDLPIEISWPDEQELKELPYRSKKELSGRIRIVTIPGVDICACCAPHVRHTGEIGLLRVLSLQNYKGGVRVTIACGGRAFSCLSEHSAALTAMAREFSTSVEEVPGQVKKLREELSETKRRLSEAVEKSLEQKLDLLIHDITTSDMISNDMKADDIKSYLLFEPAVEAGSARRVLNRFMEKNSGICGIFSGNESEGYRYLIGSAGSDVRTAAKRLGDAFGARGGGSAEMVQGQVQASEEEIRKVLCGEDQV